VFGVSPKKKTFDVVCADDVEKLENDMLTTLRSKKKFNIKFPLQTTPMPSCYTFRVEEQENL
jgi:hypothetical protein